jgi:hypothetical protein
VDGLEASQFIRSDTGQTLSPNYTWNGQHTFNGVVYGIYHGIEEDHYYFDDYNGARNVSTFLKTQRSDIIRYGAVGDVEYWDGSAWQDGSSQLSNVKLLLDGRQDTLWQVPSTYYKFRFSVSASTSWPTLALIGAQLTWTGSNFPGYTLTVEEQNADTTWTTRVTADFTSSNGVTNWGTSFRADSALHTGRGGTSLGTRITIDFFGWSPSNPSYTTIPIQNIFILSNYAGLENTDYTNLLDYERDISAPSNLSVAGNVTVTGTVDGRDIATDGTKLDGIETGADVTDAANVTAAGALMDSELTDLAGVKALDTSTLATLTGTQTLTNKTLTAPTVTGTVIEDVYALSGTTPALEPANGSIQTWTLSGNSTPTDSLAAGEAITLMIDDGTAYTITWPTTTWVNNGGSAPTLATTGYTVVALWKVSTTLYGALVGDGS